MRDNRLRELVMRRGGRAILRPDDIGSLVAGAGAPGGAGAARARGANNLAGGGILSDIFNLRNSLEEATEGAPRRARRRGAAAQTPPARVSPPTRSSSTIPPAAPAGWIRSSIRSRAAAPSISRGGARA